MNWSGIEMSQGLKASLRLPTAEGAIMRWTPKCCKAHIFIYCLSCEEVSYVLVHGEQMLLWLLNIHLLSQDLKPRHKAYGPWSRVCTKKLWIVYQCLNYADVLNPHGKSPMTQHYTPFCATCRHLLSLKVQLWKQNQLFCPKLFDHLRCALQCPCCY